MTHITLDYVGAETDFSVDDIDKPGGLPAHVHHLCEGRKTIHVQRWAAVSKEDAHSLLQAGGYAGFVDLRKAKTRAALLAGTSPKKKTVKPVAEEVEEDLDIGPYEPDEYPEPEVPEKTRGGLAKTGS